MEPKYVIGVTPYKRKTEPFDVYVPEGITRAVSALGGETRMLDYTRLKLYELIGECAQLDGAIFAGGVDVHPRHYGEAVEAGCGDIDERRDEIELNLMPLLLARRLPVLGICRGCQVINVALGGTLTQDIPNHRQDDAQGRFHHAIDIVKGTQLRALLGADTINVNSYHHQCVKALAPGLIANAYAREGFPEGFERIDEDTFILGLEWHPESTLDADEYSMKPFRAFMRAVEARTI